MNDAALSLAGRTVAIVHPAWHSCGTYQVVLGQIAAYGALGARVLTIACSDQPGFKPDRAWIWKGYVDATPELDASQRFFAGSPLRNILSPQFLEQTLWPWLHGDQAVIRTGFAEIARLSEGLASEAIDLVHCNHFFCMPVARRIAPGKPLVLDSHDLQAKQFALMNERRFSLRPHTSYEEMLARELKEMSRADALLHLNADECEAFRKLLPEQPHHLLYPAVPDVATGPGGPRILVVASRNTANVDSILWFLREVAPRAPEASFVIAGNVDGGVKSRDASLYEKHRASFLGRVDDLSELYGRARLALLPTIAGTGLSIKTVEAMASGLPLIATAQAFRGMHIDPAAFRNVVLAETPGAFASALLEASAQTSFADESARSSSDTRAAYAATFSDRAYRGALQAIVGPLLR